MTINTSGDNIPTFWQNTAAGGTPITGGDQGNLTVREEAAVDAAAQLAGSYVDAMVPPPFNLGNLGGGQTVALGSIHGSAREATVIATLSAATGILTITGLEAGTRVYIRLTQDATGNRSFSLSVGGSVSQHAVDYRPLKPTVFLLMATSATTYQLLTLPSVDTSIEFGWAPGSWIRTMDATNRNADLDDMVATGAKWLRVEADQWAVQETDATTYNWAALDALVNAATSRGLKVLLMCGVTPPWARAAGPGWYPPDNVATFAKWCKDVAARYKPGGTLGLSSTTGVTAYEVWNEVNILTFFLSGPNPTTYAAMLAAAYDQLKIEQPNCTVITGGFSPAADDGTNIAPVTFLQGIYSAGAGSKFDALGHHPYCSPALPGEVQSWSAWHQMYGATTSLRTVMINNGHSARKIWATEYGTFTNGPLSDAGAVQTEAGQATHLDTAMKLWKTYDFAGPMMIYELRDMNTADGGIDGNDATTRENHFGHALHTDRSVKPARAVFIANK